MTHDEWRELIWFSSAEDWEDADKMSFELLVKLDALRCYIGHPIIIHCGYASKGHSKNSMHYTGQAVDIHIVDISIVEAWLAAERFDFGGIGVYPRWGNPGLHLDVRYARPGARWIYTYEFMQLNAANLEVLL